MNDKQLTEYLLRRMHEVRKIHGPFNSKNEVYGVLAEEMHELVEVIHQHEGNGEDDYMLFEELLDIAVVSMRAALQLKNEGVR